MEILSFEIHKNNRFMLLGRDTLSATFDKKTILVRGGNGSGKSTLFGELTPLPSDRKDYGEGGYKKIVILFKGREYISTSDFSKRTPFYSLMVDDEELNPAGIVTTQRLLCEQIFGITPLIHDILIGRELLTEMGIGTRKKLITSSTKLNVDSVLRDYNKLNESLNLNKLMYKNTVGQYQIEENKLIDEIKYKEIKDEVEYLRNYMDKTIETRNYISRYHNSESTEEHTLKLVDLVKERDALFRSRYYFITPRPRNRIEQMRLEQLDKLGKVKNLLSSSYDRIEQLNILKEKMESSGLEDIDSLKKEMALKKEEVSSLRASLKYIEEGSDLNSIFKITDLIEDIDNLPINLIDDEYVFSKTKLDICESKIEDLNSAINELSLTEKHHSQLLTDAKEHSGKLTCPNCEISWSMLELINLDQTKSTIEDVVKRRGELSEQLKIEMAYKERCLRYFDTFSRINRGFKSIKDIFPKLYNDSDFSNTLLSYPKGVIAIINRARVDYGNLEIIDKNNKEIEVLESKIKTLSTFSSGDVADVNLELTLLDEDIFRLLEDEATINKELFYIDVTSSTYKELDKIGKMIEFCKDRTRENNLSKVALSLMNILSEDILNVKVRITELDTLVHNQENIEYTLNNLKNNLLEIEEEVEVLSIIVKELSPKNGLLARTTSSFLNGIIRNVNTVISSIWSYDMALTEIDLENCDLDYKFKLEIEGKPASDDVKLASSGQKEAINLAFKLVNYILLNIPTYPLFLDELAANMDDLHTDNISKLVHSFINESNFSQVFIISHKENMSHFDDVNIVELS